MRQIEIIIDQEGNATMDAMGYTGGLCEQTLQEIIIAAGGQEVEDSKKPEYFDPNGDNLDEIFTGNNQ